MIKIFTKFLIIVYLIVTQLWFINASYDNNTKYDNNIKKEKLISKLFLNKTLKKNYFLPIFAFTYYINIYYYLYLNPTKYISSPINSNYAELVWIIKNNN